MISLSLAQASAIVEAVIATARELECRPLGVAVLDAGGHLKAFAREDGASILRPQIAIGKAWGALGMGMGSRAVAKMAAEGSVQQAFIAALDGLAGGRVVPAPGGVLVRDAEGQLLGAVGVTGDSSDRDESCAVAAIEGLGLGADPG